MNYRLLSTFVLTIIISCQNLGHSQWNIVESVETANEQLDSLYVIDSLLFDAIPESFEEYYSLMSDIPEPLRRYNFLLHLNQSDYSHIHRNGMRNEDAFLDRIITLSISGKVLPEDYNYLQDLIRMYVRGYSHSLFVLLNSKGEESNVSFWRFVFSGPDSFMSIPKVQRFQQYVKNHTKYLYSDAISTGYEERTTDVIELHSGSNCQTCITEYVIRISRIDSLLLKTLPHSFEDYMQFCGFNENDSINPYVETDLIDYLLNENPFCADDLTETVIDISINAHRGADQLYFLGRAAVSLIDKPELLVQNLNTKSRRENELFWRFVFDSLDHDGELSNDKLKYIQQKVRPYSYKHYNTIKRSFFYYRRNPTPSDNSLPH